MRSIYEAVVYLFVVHPYDVGDAVLVGPNQDWCNVSIFARLSIPKELHLNTSDPLVDRTHFQFQEESLACQAPLSYGCAAVLSEQQISEKLPNVKLQRQNARLGESA